MSPTLIERLAQVPRVGADLRPVSVSPDGRTVAIAWHRGGDWQIYTLPVEGGEPKRVAEIDDACICPHFSPDGRYLYFSRDDRGSECYDIYRFDISSGALVNLLPDTPALSISPDFTVSPDGARIAFSADHDGGYKAAVMVAEASPGGAAIRVLTDHYFNDGTPHWAPDSRRIAFGSDTHGQDSAVSILDVDGGDVRTIGGETPVLAWSPAWSPDGQTIAFTGVLGDHYAIGLYDVGHDAVEWAWDGDRDTHQPVWSPDGSSLLFLADRDAETALWHLDLHSQTVRDISAGRGNHYAPAFLPGGEEALVVLSGPGVPEALFRVDLATGAATQLVENLPDDLRDHRFGVGEHVTYRSLDRITDVPALLFRPENHNGSGVVIVHGGPTWHHSNEWDPLREAFLAAGCMVVHPNYRGSDGYGRTWQLANHYLVGDGEIQDSAGAAAFLVSQGCDPERIAVTGRSWGGFHTMAVLTQFPDLWAAAVAGVPFFDFIFAQNDPNVRDDLVWWDRENSGDLVKDRARLEYYSPINHLERIKAPLLMLAAALDPRCPPAQVDEVAERIRANGVECDWHIYPDEGHEISGLAHRIDYEKRTVDFIVERVGA